MAPGDGGDGEGIDSIGVMGLKKGDVVSLGNLQYTQGLWIIVIEIIIYRYIITYYH